METQTKSVKERIVLISNEIRIAKTGKNEFVKANYFKPDEILATINPLLSKHNLISIFNMPYSKADEMYKGILVIEDFSTTERVEYSFDIPMTELKGTGKAQNAGATQTYCKRYMFMNAFNLADNKADPDANKLAQNIDYSAKLKATKSLEELKKAFASLPAIEKGNLFTLKEELKQKYASK